MLLRDENLNLKGFEVLLNKDYDGELFEISNK